MVHISYVVPYIMNDLVAVAVLPVDRTTVHYGGRHTVVHYANGETWHKFLVEPSDKVLCMETGLALERAQQLRDVYNQTGQLAPEPL